MSKKATKPTTFEDEETAGAGHNNPPTSAEELRSLIKRYEKLDEEKTAIAEDMREVVAEAKSKGFEPKIFRAVYKLHQVATSERDEYFAKLECYAKALGFSILDFEPEELED